MCQAPSLNVTLMYGWFKFVNVQIVPFRRVEKVPTLSLFAQFAHNPSNIFRFDYAVNRGFTVLVDDNCCKVFFHA